MIVGNGRPLRFLAMVGGGWIGLRVLFLWHATGSLPAAIRQVVPYPDPSIAAVPPSGVATAPGAVAERRPVRLAVSLAPLPWGPVAMSTAPVAVDPVRVQLALLAMTRVARSGAEDEVAIVTLPPRSAIPVQSQPSRWSVSSWLIARGGTGLGASALSPQLGGTQGGVRIDYALGSGFAATGRLAAPAAGAGREVSIGIAWRPAGVPIRIVAEQRLALDRGRGGPALGVSGGVSSVDLPAGFRLDGYGQAGMIARNGLEKYLDASMRAARPAADVGGVALDLGAGAWGGAQRGVARVDIGPSIGAQLPIVGRSLRLALDWRQRIVGNARPGSGPALTLGTDF